MYIMYLFISIHIIPSPFPSFPSPAAHSEAVPRFLARFLTTTTSPTAKAPAVGGWGQTATGGEAVTNDQESRILLDVITPRENVRALTEEETAEVTQRYRDYSRRMMRREHAWRADVQDKIKLKEEAIRALPEELQAAASEPDLEPFPLDRWLATLTPPRREGAGARGEAREAGGASGSRVGKVGDGTKRR